MQQGLVKIISLMRPEEAHIVQGKLESEGIKSYLGNENVVRMDFLLSQAVGGVEVWVSKDDAERAQEILAEADTSVTDLTAGKGDRCPKCGSSETTFKRGPTTLTKAFFYLGIPLPFLKRGWKCGKCSYFRKA